jgi:eukaryotic-like serine/threonine-protein kinase
LILAPSDGDLEIESRWAEATVKLCKSERAKPWSHFCRGLAEYRQGHFAEAVGWLQSALSRGGDIHARDVEAYMVLAMAQFQLHQPQAARDALTEGQKIDDTDLPKMETGLLDDSWKDCLIAFALMREAKALINGTDNPR